MKRYTANSETVSFISQFKTGALKFTSDELHTYKLAQKYKLLPEWF